TAGQVSANGNSMPKTQPAPAATSALAFGREHASDPAAAGAPVRRRALVRPERLRLSKAEATSAPTSACSPASRATPASARRRGFDRPEPRREQSLVAQADSSAQLGKQVRRSRGPRRARSFRTAMPPGRAHTPASGKLLAATLLSARRRRLPPPVDARPYWRGSPLLERSSSVRIVLRSS